MICEVFVDMDGVLCDFKKRFYELYKDIPEIDYPSKNKEKLVYKSRFDEFIENGHFATLEPMLDFSDAISFLGRIEDEFTIKILSSTAQEKYIDIISGQKERWLTEWKITYPAIFVPGKKLKQHYAKPDSLLIDDTLSSIVEWREQGGIAIHHTSWEQTINEFYKLHRNC